MRNSRYTGKGVKMAVLDTGFDFTHPDFAGRVIHRKSFVGRQAKDREGHGTFCVGIAGGGRKGKAGPRYGVASGARLFVGKILDDAGEGSDATALAGIEWALEKGCQVISMSFGAAVTPGEGYSEIFEDVARTAMANNCLLIAATGNESDREEGIVGLINHPANCPSVLAVAALTESLKVANYSCAGVKKLSGKSVGGRGASGGLGEVNIAAPGDNIMSASMGGGHDEESGTSMATPFVAGVVALLWEQFPKAGAGEIWEKLIKGVEPIGQPKVDVGAGLVFVR
ncbi:S8 family peptidase [Puia sp. P3]|uniref:S8 family peptidase n=1 Tax=Puia sp. P3 TaxID=3423952 RepID=UPI003D66D92E